MTTQQGDGLGRSETQRAVHQAGHPRRTDRGSHSAGCTSAPRNRFPLISRMRLKNAQGTHRDPAARTASRGAHAARQARRSRGRQGRRMSLSPWPRPASTTGITVHRPRRRAEVGQASSAAASPASASRFAATRFAMACSSPRRSRAARPTGPASRPATSSPRSVSKWTSSASRSPPRRSASSPPRA